MKKTVLLVEDEDADVIFMQIAMKAAGLESPLVIARDGRAALAYLKGEDPYADRLRYPLPDLVLLDLRLPYVPGLEVLKQLRACPDCARVSVLVMSASNQDTDVETAYGLGANGYLVKPPLLSELKRAAALIKKYWIDSDAPPPDCPDWQSVVVPRQRQ